MRRNGWIGRRGVVRNSLELVRTWRMEAYLDLEYRSFIQVSLFV